MKKPTIMESMIIQMTLENVRSFYNRNKDITIMPMTDNFMWIGSNDFQWCESLDEFHCITENEYKEPSVLLTDEEYHVLFHERNIWVLYGRYKATAVLDDGSMLHAHVRGTYIWRKIKGELKLAHVHGSHAQDIPLNHIPSTADPFTKDTDFFDYMKHLDMVKSDEEKIVFRDSDKNHRYLFPFDILYLKAAGQHTTVCTMKDNFQVCGLLADQEKKLPATFRRIHKSFLVNSTYIDTIYRYKAVLKYGQELPIGKERYMDLKRYLQKK